MKDTHCAALAFRWRAFVAVVALLSFAALAASGFVLWLAPPGRIANWGNWSPLGLRKTEWAGLHIWFALVFAVAAIVHLVFNWRPLLGYLKNKSSRQWGFRWEWLAATALCAMVFVGVRCELPPFSSLLVFTRNMRQGWGQPGGWGHRAGTANPPGGIPTNSTDGVGGPDFGASQSRSGGGGYGHQTLAEYCAGTGVDLAAAQNRLKTRGIEASPQQTLREIAEDNGFQRPSELLRIIRGESEGID